LYKQYIVLLNRNVMGFFNILDIRAEFL